MCFQKGAAPARCPGYCPRFLLLKRGFSLALLVALVMGPNPRCGLIAANLAGGARSDLIAERHVYIAGLFP